MSKLVYATVIYNTHTKSFIIDPFSLESDEIIFNTESDWESILEGFNAELVEQVYEELEDRLERL